MSTRINGCCNRESGFHAPNCAAGTVAAHDPVNHPKHYTSHPSGVECITVVEHMGFCLGNVIKYCWRAGLKESADTVEDLRKAAWYLDREIKRRERFSK